MGYFRPMLLAGNFLVVLGIMMLSLSTKYWQVFLSQGICMGLGAGLLYIPSLALVGIWFDKKRALAMGIVMSGIAVGAYFLFHPLVFLEMASYGVINLHTEMTRWCDLHYHIRSSVKNGWLSHCGSDDRLCGPGRSCSFDSCPP